MNDQLIVERLQDIRICDIGLRRVAANRIKQLSDERDRLREAALREALAAVNAKWRSGADTPDEMRGLALAEAAILALIDKPAHVNETPKSEHEDADMLTPDREAALRDALAVAIDELRSGPCALEARRFLQSAVGVEILALIDRSSHD